MRRKLCSLDGGAGGYDLCNPGGHLGNVGSVQPFYPFAYVDNSSHTPSQSQWEETHFLGALFEFLPANPGEVSVFCLSEFVEDAEGYESNEKIRPDSGGR